MKIQQWIRRHRTEVIIALLIFVVGAGLRLYAVGDLMHFGGDESRDSFVVRSISRDGDVQLLGPSASPGDSAFHLGPFFYYLLTPGYWLSDNAPASGAWTVALFSVATIALLYYLVRRWFGWIGALATTLLYSVSWLVVYYGRWAWNPNVIPFFVVGIFIALYYLAEAPPSHKKWWLYGLAALVALVTQLHGTAIFILPPLLILYFIIFRPRVSWYAYLIAVGILLVLNAPLIVYDVQNDLSNSNGFWNIVTEDDGADVAFGERVSQTYDAFINFYHESLLHLSLPAVLYSILVGALVVLFWRFGLSLRHKKRDTVSILLLLWVAVPLIVFIFYSGVLPPHYFSFLFPVPFILIGVLCAWLWQRKWWRVSALLLVLTLGGILSFHTIILLEDLQPNGSRATSYPITLVEMEQVAEYIIADAASESFHFEVFPESYRNSFQYLFDERDVLPGVTGSDIVYTVIWGRQPLLSNFVDPASIVGTELFGVLTVVKNKPSLP